MPNLVEIIEKIVLAMDDDLRDCIVIKYVKRRSDRFGAHLTHCGSTEFRNRVNMGVAFTSGYIACLGIKIFDT